MKYFDTYVSNTLAASSNQFWFSTNGKEKHTRAFFRIFEGGTYDYSLLFTNIMDGTFDYGTESHSNMICGEWDIRAASVAVVSASTVDFAGVKPNLIPIFFDGKTVKNVLPGSYFTADPIKLTAKKGDYLCLDMRVIGDCIPCLREIQIPTLSENNGVFIDDYAVPLASMIGCNRKVDARIGFLGDSITEGIGVPLNSYLHWNARIADKIGACYSYWNLGLGYGRAADAATDSAWLHKAKQVDICTVCYGVNDIFKDYSAKEIVGNLRKIVTVLKDSGVKVILFTVPPFDFTGEYLQTFTEVNRTVREELRYLADGFFDFDAVVGSGENFEIAPYGGHPGAEGCELLAEAFVNTVDFGKFLS